MFSKELPGGYLIREVTGDEIQSCLNEHFDSMFRNRIDSGTNYVVSEDGREKMNERARDDHRFRLRLGVFSEGRIIGWHYGFAVDAETYYMQNSAILPSWQGKGLYSQLLDCALERLAQEGFQVITSAHHPNNPAVLIPKLKKGFVITGVQLHERFRFLVEMKYIFNEDRRKSLHRNIGLEF